MALTKRTSVSRKRWSSVPEIQTIPIEEYERLRDAVRGDLYLYCLGESNAETALRAIADTVPHPRGGRFLNALDAYVQCCLPLTVVD